MSRVRPAVRARALSVAAVLLLTAGCQQQPIFVPVLGPQSFVLLGECRRTGDPEAPVLDCGCDPSVDDKPGRALYPPTVAGAEAACPSRVLLDRFGRTLRITWYNLLLPCFPENAVEALRGQRITPGQTVLSADADPDTDGDEAATDLSRYFAVLDRTAPGFEMAVGDRIHVITRIEPAAELSDNLCAYQLQTEINNLPGGNYFLRVWDRQRRAVAFSDSRGRPLGSDPTTVFLGLP